MILGPWRLSLFFTIVHGPGVSEVPSLVAVTIAPLDIASQAATSEVAIPGEATSTHSQFEHKVSAFAQAVDMAR
jgi:hypothetical protein